LISWHRGGLDIEQRLPMLSTWLGHSSPRDTYWYLTAVPELLELVVDRVEAGALEP
jgi:integrase